MNNPLEQEGVLAVVLERFEKHTLPRIFDIKNQIDNGGTLSSSNIEFLEEVLSDARKYESFVEKRADFKELFARSAHLYNEITKKALENEKSNGTNTPFSE